MKLVHQFSVIELALNEVFLIFVVYPVSGVFCRVNDRAVVFSIAGQDAQVLRSDNFPFEELATMEVNMVVARFEVSFYINGTRFVEVEGQEVDADLLNIVLVLQLHSQVNAFIHILFALFLKLI